MSERKRYIDQATESLQRIISCGRDYSIAAALNDRQDLGEIRDEARAQLDAYLDRMGLAGATARKPSGD